MLGTVHPTRVVDHGFGFTLEEFWFRVWSVEVREVWALYGDWILDTRPDSPVLRPETFEAALRSTAPETAEARRVWHVLRKRIRGKVPEGSVMCLPTAIDRAPGRGLERGKRTGFVRPTLCLMSVAGVAGLPQITLPVAEVDGCPVGLSFVGPAGSDERPLDLAVRFMGTTLGP